MANSELFYKLKAIYNNMFEIAEVTMANAAMKVKMRRQLSKQLRGIPALTSIERQECKSFSELIGGGM